MRLARNAHPNGWRNHLGDVYRVLRNGDEVSAWTERAEAERALKAAVAEEVRVERGRLPANARAHLTITDAGLSYAPGGHAMWSVEFSLDAVHEPRERLAD